MRIFFIRKKRAISVDKNTIEDNNEYYLFITIVKENGNNNKYKSIKVRYSSSSPSPRRKTYMLLIITLYIVLDCLFFPLIVYIWA